MLRGLHPQVALVREQYQPIGGTGSFFGAALAALRERGAVVTFVTRRWPDTDGTALILDPAYVGELWRDWGFARAARRALAARPFDLIQSHEPIPGCALYCAEAGVLAEWFAQRSRTQAPYQRAASALSLHRLYLLAAERALFADPRLRLAVCPSEMVRGEIAFHYRVSPDRLELVRPAVDRARFHPGLRSELRAAVREQLHIPPSANVVLHLGPGFERSGVESLLGAIARAGGERWVIVAGTDASSHESVAIARSLGIAERVRFVGALSDPRPYYAAADCFALAALYAPFPQAALEAMACGLPVVTTPKCGAAELLVEGETGFVRDALDLAGLAEAFSRLDPSTAARLGANAADVVAPFTPEALARQCAALYERLLYHGADG